MDLIDNFLNRITMYRLVLHYLIFLWLIALAFSTFGLLPYSPIALIFSLAFIMAASWITNTIFARIYKTPANVESLYITALILALIITPYQSTSGLGYLGFLALASIWAMASKFIFAIGKKHIFNPAAFAVALTAFTINQSASWWIGNAYLMPFVLIGGLLLVRKLKRKDLIIHFLLVALIVIIGTGLMKGTGFWTIFQKAVLESPLLFFAFVMLTEPLTTPSTEIRQIAYGSLVGFLFAPSIHIGSVYSTPELALLIGNVFSYLISPKKKLLLTLDEKIPVGRDMHDFVFTADGSMNFRPGQYLEWTLGHADPDDRGNRRYFTIASSPTEEKIRMGVKFYPEASSFKRSLLDMKIGDTIIASQLSGEFVLPKDKNEKLVFIAGGIGVTPFRSMIKYLLDNHESRDIVLFYSNKTKEEIAYKKIFDRAEKELGIKTIYALTDKDVPLVPWCRRGRVDDHMIMEEVPDCLERTYYISGPRGMVVAYENMLKNLGISRRQIKTDFFPGFV